MGTDGQVILEPTYEVIKKFRNGHAKVKLGELWGMIDKAGKVIIPIEYDEIGNTYHASGVFGSKGGSYGIISNRTFNVIIGADKVWNFKGDSGLTYARKNKKMGFVNAKGEWVIQPVFDKVRAFSDGLAPAAMNKMWGFIDKSGEMIIAPLYRDAEIFSDGMAPVKDKKWGFIDKSGNLIIPMEYGITAGLAFISGRDSKGFMNGLTRVKSKKGWGFMDKSGKLLANKWFENAEPFVKN
jgi:hypothetical protein